MKYYLFGLDNVPISEADDVKTALQVFGKVYDEDPDTAKDYQVQIFLEIKPGKMKFYHCYWLSDFLTKSPVFYEPTPEQEDEHYIKSMPEKLCMTESQIKSYNEGDIKQFKAMAASFTDEEYKAVLQYIPTGFIIGEIARRFEEYHNATNEILSTINNMKLFQNDDKKGN